MVFISYSWDSDEHIERVSRLVKLLKRSGIQVVWDKKMELGNRIPSFMEESLQKCSQVLFICTPNYKLKADKRDGGVGYETNIITGDLYRTHNEIKYIPVLFEGSWDTSMPVWASGKLGADLRKESMLEYGKLLDALGDQEEALAVLKEKGDSEVDKPSEVDEPLEEPASPEERQALEQIYQGLLEFKTWLVGLVSSTSGGMTDPSGSEDEMREKVKKLRRIKDTYDFVLKENVVEPLNKFFSYWKNFEYNNAHYVEETARVAAKYAEKKQGILSKICRIGAGNMLWYSYSDLKDACNAVLSAIARRLG